MCTPALFPRLPLRQEYVESVVLLDEAGYASGTADKPIVIKADGLAGGKGVVVSTSLAEAETAVAMIFSGAFGSGGSEVVVEEFLTGEEVSFFALCDGQRAVAFASA